MKFLLMFVSISDTYRKKNDNHVLKFMIGGSASFNLHFNQLVQFILNSTNFHLKKLFAIDDRKMKLFKIR